MLTYILTQLPPVLIDWLLAMGATNDASDGCECLYFGLFKIIVG